MKELPKRNPRDLSMVLVGLAAALWVLLSSCSLTPIEQRFPQTTCPERCFPDEGPLRMSDLTVDESMELPFDLTGVWAHQEIASSLSSVPLIGDVETTTIDTLLVRMVQSGGRVEMVAESCGMDTFGTSDAGQVRIPPSYIDAMEPSQRSAVIEPWDQGYRLRQERYTRVLGAELTDLENEPLPEEHDDPRVVDIDGDGEPGVTVLMDGLLEGEIYLLQRSWIELCGAVLSPNRLEGYIRWGTEQSVVDASSLFLESTPDSVPNPDWEMQRFVSCRVEDDMTCEQLFTDREAIFAACDGGSTEPEMTPVSAASATGALDSP